MARDGDMKIIYRRTVTALENLVLNCIDQQKVAAKQRLCEPNTRRWLMEWCRVSLNCSRHCGTTTAMINIGSHYFRNPMFVCSDFASKKRLAERAPKNAFITTANNIDREAPGRVCDAIFVDSLSEIPTSIYDVAQAMTNRSDTFVLAFINCQQEGKKDGKAAASRTIRNKNMGNS